MPRARALAAIAALAVAAAVSMSAGVEVGPARALEDVTAPAKPTPVKLVPITKLQKAVRARDAAAAEARSLRRTLRHSPSVQEALTIGSIAYRIDRADLSSTAYCESTHNPRARNGQYLGLMQLGDGFRAASPYFRAGLDPFSPYANIIAAAEVISAQGYRQWQCRPGGKLAW